MYNTRPSGENKVDLRYSLEESSRHKANASVKVGFRLHDIIRLVEHFESWNP